MDKGDNCYSYNQGSSHRKVDMASGNKEAGPSWVNKDQSPRSKQAMRMITHVKPIITGMEPRRRESWPFQRYQELR